MRGSTDASSSSGFSITTCLPSSLQCSSWGAGVVSGAYHLYTCSTHMRVVGVVPVTERRISSHRQTQLSKDAYSSLRDSQHEIPSSRAN